MLFLLKKIIAAFLMPISIVIVLGLFGLLLIAAGRRKLLGYLAVLSAFALLLAGSLPPVAYELVRPLEASYAPIDDSIQLSYILVLGGGHNSDPAVPVSSMLNAASLYRLVEGVRLANKNPEAKLFLSGYAEMDAKSNAEVYRDVAIALGVAPERIQIEPRPKDTAEEAMYVREAIGTQPFALVTSAMHMPRAMQIFRAAGLSPIAAPTGFEAKAVSHPDWRHYKPQAEALLKTQAAMHEYLGRGWALLTGHE